MKCCEIIIRRLLIVSLFLLSCSQPSDTVAHIGKQRISLAEFRMAYLEVLKQPTMFDSPQLREQFLNEMIERRLLAEEARRMGLDKNEHFILRAQAHTDKALREAHFQAKIKPQIKISDDDLRQVYAFTQEERRIRHLFCETKTQAEHVYRRLQEGVTFAELASQLFAASTLATNGGDLGWVQWEQLEYDLAMTAFTLPIGVVSRPVESSHGFHIIRVDDYRRQLLLSEDEFHRRERRVRGMLEKKVGDKLAAAYIRDLMAKKKIRVHPKTLRIVGEKLAMVLRRVPAATDQMQQMQLNDLELQQLESGLWDIRHQVLAELDETPLTVGAFIAGLNYVPYSETYRSLKTALDFVLRDLALTQEAKAMKLHKTPFVQMKSRIFQDYVLQMALRTKLIQDIRVDEAEIDAFYQRHLDKRFKNMPYEKVHDIVARQALEEKRQTTIDALIENLKAQQKIETNPQIIHNYYDRLGLDD